MKKIYIVAGIVLLFVLILFCWVFIGNFFDFAQNLGDTASDISTVEKSKFIGTWETTYIDGDERFIGSNGIYLFKSDGTGSIGSLDCTWTLENEKLKIYYYEGFSSLSYNYTFSNEDNTLTLTNLAGSLEFIKK